MPSLDHLLKTSDLVKRAYDLAKRAHRSQRRRTGEPFFEHPVAAANMIAEWNLDDATVAAALLHDVVEDTDYTLADIKQQFGDEVAFLVEGVTQIDKVSFSGLERDTESLRKFVVHLSRDVRVILVKLADRYHNMKTLYILSPESQKRKALETMELYAPLAYRLGMYTLAGELEDLSFPYIYPQEYKWLIKNVQDLYESRVRFAERFHKDLEQHLLQKGIRPLQIESRAKRYTSLYKKLLRYDMDIEKVHDLVALRVITKTIDECYACLKAIHERWPQTPRGSSDYIAKPKENGYQSIHTDVYGPEGKIIEIQIRTEAMHREAELGVAARFAYDRIKESPEYALAKPTAHVDASSSWIRRLLQWRENPDKKSTQDIFKDTILVLSPKKDILELPKGATALDFAYKIHEHVGKHAVSAKRNGQDIKLGTPLAFGDVVEIITQSSARPKTWWLSAAKTRYAQNKIRLELDKIAKEKEQILLTRETEIDIYLSKLTPIINQIQQLANEEEVLIMRTEVLPPGGVLRRSRLIRIRCKYMNTKKQQRITELLQKLPYVHSVKIKSVTPKED